ncbi:MAG: hypothetical protein ACI8ZB_005542 [Desulforhopalus sp.]|jgi:hypothetical protein
MNRTQNDDTRYFVEIDLDTLKYPSKPTLSSYSIKLLDRFCPYLAFP